MAKTAKLKKREATIHSRAARRAVSPSIDLDKKLKTTSRDSSSPKPTDVKHHVLATQNAGIQKKAKKGNMKRAQRLRHQKGMERAFDNLEKREVKVAKSIGKEKKVRDRRKGWDDINSNGTSGKKTKQNAFGALEDDSDKRKEREWVSDEEMDDDANEVQETAAGDAVKGAGRDVEVVIPQSVPLPAEDDELL